mgnify:FL=1
MIKNIKYMAITYLYCASTLGLSASNNNLTLANLISASNIASCGVGQGVGLSLLSYVPSLSTPMSISAMGGYATCSIPPMIPAALGCCIITSSAFQYYVLPKEEKQKSSCLGKASCCILGGCFAVGLAKTCGPQVTTGIYCCDTMRSKK